MRCPNCHGTGVHADSANGRWVCVYCDECKGSGVIHCCEGLTQGVIDMTRVEYWHDVETPDNTGWYICHYGTVDDMLAKSPEDAIGPYETEAEAKRILAETSDSEVDRRQREYNARTPSLPIALDAGIPTDNEVDTD